MPTALITGITGQDGSYLAELLLSKGYRVIGVARRSSTVTNERIEHLLDDITVVQGDLHDQGSLLSLLEEYQPSEVYNLAAQSFVPTSWNQPALTGDITALGVTRILESIRYVNPKIRFYQASSSEMFGRVVEVPQCETTPFYPRSPYGVAKVYGHWITVNYRESFGMFATSGILFNHESPRRGLEFVTRKISNGVARIRLGLAHELRLGNLESHSVREFCEIAFGHVDLDYNDYVIQDERFYRPAEVDLLISDPSRARTALGWEASVSFKDLVIMMVDSDLERLKKK
jgi:GDPmannose 4,6-dehydratase